MKQIFLFLVLIFLVSCLEDAKNVNPRDYPICSPFTNPDGVSDCVDLNLANDDTKKNLRKYFDKCCFIRYMELGTIYKRCIALSRDDTMDIIDYIKLGEKETRENLRDEYQGSRDGYVKIYSIDCEASYIKIFIFAFALFGLLF